MDTITSAPILLSLAGAARTAVLQGPVGADVPFPSLPLLEVLVGAVAMAGLFVLFGLRAPAERSDGCGGCSGECGSCELDGEEPA